MSEVGAPAERPSLETQPCRPDVLVRLRELGEALQTAGYLGLTSTVIDAIDAIQGERATAARRLAMISVAKGERDKARARVAELEAVVRSAGNQFRDYQAQHRAKGTLDGDVKAITNGELADMCEVALSAPKPAGETP